jgi:hypothetical protein
MLIIFFLLTADNYNPDRRIYQENIPSSWELPKSDISVGVRRSLSSIPTAHPENSVKGVVAALRSLGTGTGFEQVFADWVAAGFSRSALVLP